jgi:hypothetical protein
VACSETALAFLMIFICTIVWYLCMVGTLLALSEAVPVGYPISYLFPTEHSRRKSDILKSTKHTTNVRCKVYISRLGKRGFPADHLDLPGAGRYFMTQGQTHWAA